MSGDFNASVVISTAESEKGLRNLDNTAKDLDKTLRNLDGALKGAQGNLDSVAKSMAELTRANAALIRSDRDRAKATTEAARADGVRINNSSKLAKTAREQALAEAKIARIRQGGVASGLGAAATSARRDAEARVRMDAQAAIGAQRLATETERTTAASTRGAMAQQQLASATARTELTQLRLAQAQQKAASGALELNDNLSNSRYLLYDVGQTFTVISGALMALPIATSAVAIAYERDFAQVIRTNDTLNATQFGDLRQELKQLATEIPLTFGQFAEISTIAGQLGIAGKDVGAFTESVARFGAASNVSLDEAATSFGRLQQSFKEGKTTPDFFNKIGSAIAYVGVKSAATETEIIAVSNQISAAGAQFGFAAEEVVGLSGALASVRIRPELARGAFQRIMLELSRAADEGGEAFDRFAKYTGTTGEAAQKLFKNDPSEFFHKYIGGIKGVIDNGASVSSVLDDIGAKNVFDKQFILGLANGYDVYTEALQNSNSAWEKGSFLSESTGPIFETMDAKIKRIASSFQNLSDTLAKGSLSADGGEAGGLAKIADTILNISGAADRFARSAPGMTAAVNAFLALGGAIGVLLAFKAAQAFAMAGMVGFQQIMGAGTLRSSLSAKGAIQQLAVTMLMSKGVSAATAAEFVKTAGAMKAMGFAASATSTQVRAANAGIGTLGTTAKQSSSGVVRFGGTLKNVATGALSLVGGPLGALVTMLGIVGLKFIETEERANQAGDAIARAMQNGAEAGKRSIGEELVKTTVDSFDPRKTAAGLGDHGKNIRVLAEEIGLDFNKIVDAVSKGSKANEEFKRTSDALAQSKGYKDYADMLARSTDGSAQKLGFINQAVEELGKKSEKSQGDLKAVDKAAGGAGESAAAAAPNAEELAAGLENVGDEAETASDKIDKLIAQIFGIANAESATQEALNNLGEGLANSLDFSTSTEGGRENIANYQEALAAAAREQQNLIETTGKGVQQATADYTAFVDGLTQEMAARGVDPAMVSAVAEQAKQGVSKIFGEGVDLPVKVDTDQTLSDLSVFDQTLREFLKNNNPHMAIAADTTPAQQAVLQLAQDVSTITGEPYEVVLAALTDPANENAARMQQYIVDIVNGKYEAKINTDTSAAIANVMNFSNYTRAELFSLQGVVSNVAGMMESFGLGGVKKIANNMLNNYKSKLSTGTASAAPTQVKAAPTAAATPNFGGLSNGYDKVKEAAKKAGDAGKKAGDDMKDGIDSATKAAEDYANRLKTGLQSAFDQQHGLQKATDEYHSALNAIAKKREDEIKQIDDLIEKQKELNNERNEELVNARKAGIEKNISIKYGEVDRAADYAAQEQAALDAAAAKGKDIDANGKAITSIRNGMYVLDGYSEAAIENREALRNLESKMLDMISAYAATGASQEQVANYARGLTNTFGIQVSQMGYNQGSLNALIGTTQRYIDTIYKVPYRVVTDSENDFAAGAANAAGLAGAINAIPTSVNTQVKVEADTTSFVRKWMQLYSLRDNYLQNLPAVGPGGTSAGIPLQMYKGGTVPGFASGGLIPGKAPSDPRKDNLLASVDGKGLVQVRSEEFIMSQPAVDYWGTDVMNAMNNMRMPGFFSGGKVGGGSGSGNTSGGAVLVELTADNLATILRLADRPVDLYAGVEKLASTVAEGTAILASKGVG